MWKYINPLVLFLLLCILQYHHCLPPDLNSDTKVEGQKWLALPQESRPSQFPEENSGFLYIRNKRYINLGSASTDKQKLYQACVAPGNQDGHCKHLSGCMLENYNKNLTRFMDYMCIIEQTYIGICCPDNIVTHRWEKTFVDELASMLPLVANIDDDSQESNETTNKERIVSSTDNKGLNNDDVQPRNTSTRVNQETRRTGKPRGCGMTTKTKTRIVGGHPADPKEWPWMAALLRQGNFQYCGGVLITDRHVLTAAHCVYRMKPREITVRLGEYDFTRPDETRALDFSVTEIRMHRDFVYTTYENDIGIIKIHRPTMFNTYIWPVCLPPIKQSFENKSAIVTGWGTQYYGGSPSNVLMEVGVPVWSQDRCVRSFTQHIPNTTICAGAYEGGRDACQGDSGGPLLHQLSNGRWVNIGIVSWGIRCGEPGLPGVYTRVSSYLDWIFANAVF